MTFFQGADTEEGRQGALAACERRLFSGSKDSQMTAARYWFKYSEACSLLRHDSELDEKATKNDAVVYGTGRLDALYFRNNMSLKWTNC